MEFPFSFYWYYALFINTQRWNSVLLSAVLLSSAMSHCVSALHNAEYPESLN